MGWAKKWWSNTRGTVRAGTLWVSPFIRFHPRPLGHIIIVIPNTSAIHYSWQSTRFIEKANFSQGIKTEAKLSPSPSTNIRSLMPFNYRIPRPSPNIMPTIIHLSTEVNVSNLCKARTLPKRKLDAQPNFLYSYE